MDQSSIGWHFDNTYSKLANDLLIPSTPSPAREPHLAIVNHRLAEELGLNLKSISDDSIAALFSGKELPEGSSPIAQAYAGHQYGGFTMLGDGRAILLGEHRTPAGNLVDIQLKGAGRTRFSRGGDGRAALGPMLREYIMSEAMAALGIPTTRSLAVVTTGEPVFRSSPLRGAILTRIAKSHIRIGTFEYAARRDAAALKTLADYTIARHDPELTESSNKYLEFLRAVIDRQAALVARWQHVGFIHGVMNTDNVAISGETIDYGPCAFMNAYDPATVYSSIDSGGRYAFGNQPNIMHWNLARFAETLLTLIDDEPQKSIPAATEALNQFPALFEKYWLHGMRKKIGLNTEDDQDAKLITDLLNWMIQSKADFTNTFRDLSASIFPTGEPYQSVEFQAWHTRWHARLNQESQDYSSAAALMCQANPFVIPRNHRVEEALAAAEEQNDFTVMNKLLAALSSPFESKPESKEYRSPPADEKGYRTFCGT